MLKRVLCRQHAFEQTCVLLLVQHVRREHEQFVRRDRFRTFFVDQIMAQSCPGKSSQLRLDSVNPMVMRCLLLEEANEQGFRRQAAQGRIVRLDRLW